jgi:histidinol-phosphate/aromatic aminotransferase/cobyric acid decarboxylase-like protein
MLSSSDNIKYFSNTRSLVESNSLSMTVANYMLDHPEIMYEHVKNVKEGAAYLQSELNKDEVKWHGGIFSNGILIFLDNEGSSESLLSFLNRKNIYVRGSFSKP